MQKNNQTLGVAIIAIFLIATLFMPWGTFTVTEGDLKDFEVTATGLNGYLTILSFKTHHWVLVLTAVLSSLITLLSIRKVVSVPKIIPILMTLLALAGSVTGLSLYADEGLIQLGLIIMVLGSFSLLITQLRLKH